MQDAIRISLMATRQMAEDMLADAELQQNLSAAVDCCHQAIAAGHKIFFAGNGGSAAEAQHFSAELVGRFLQNRRAIAAIALHTDTSALTAIGNDFGYEQVFSRQLEALGRAGDVLVSLSTSGKSANVLAAMKTAQSLGMKNIAMTGLHPRDMGPLADITLKVPSGHTPQIQEGHLVLGHLLCALLETRLLP